MSIQSPPDGFPSVTEIDRIIALPDLVLRNLLITQGYHELSAALARTVGPASNWCTYAVWASKQAGQTIRKEDLARVLQQEIAAAPGLAGAFSALAEEALRLGSRLDALGVRVFGERALLELTTLGRASEAISRGNTKVFAEIAREFSRFLATFADDAVFDGEKIARFVAALRPGDPPDGQGFLRQAFTHLYEARFETDPGAKTERLLLVNLEIGFHEQTRLQPEIADALESALPDRDEIRRELLPAIFPGAGLLLRMRLRLPAFLRRTGPLDRALDRLCEELRNVLRRAVTEILMRLELPGRCGLRLGRDLALSFPAPLQTLVHSELLALLARIDPTADSLAGSGAEDWADFPERMHYIADLFRCLMEDAALLGPPFTAEQVLELKAGRKPSGRL